MPIHCCAMQGRVDATEMLLEADKSESILQALKEETGAKPPSVVHLAIANDCIDCSEWLNICLLCLNMLYTINKCFLFLFSNSLT